jgi:hypothetical protein
MRDFLCQHVSKADARGLRVALADVTAKLPRSGKSRATSEPRSAIEISFSAWNYGQHDQINNKSSTAQSNIAINDTSRVAQSNRQQTIHCAIEFAQSPVE